MSARTSSAVGPQPEQTRISPLDRREALARAAAAGTEVARPWRLYMSGARVGFENGDLDVAQLLLARPQADGSPVDRSLQTWW
jgi:hypothetical protein